MCEYRLRELGNPSPYAKFSADGVSVDRLSTCWVSITDSGVLDIATLFRVHHYNVGNNRVMLSDKPNEVLANMEREAR